MTTFKLAKELFNQVVEVSNEYKVNLHLLQAKMGYDAEWIKYFDEKNEETKKTLNREIAIRVANEMIASGKTGRYTKTSKLPY